MTSDAYKSGKLPEGRGGGLVAFQQESLKLKDKMQKLFEECTGDSEEESVFEFQKGCKFAFEKVMAHNDLLSGNILINNCYDGQSAPKITIIDYEYTCYNARAFDLGNHFCGK